MPKSVIHINQHAIRRNRAEGANEPVITCKTYKDNRYGHRVEILDAASNVVATVRYEPEKPLSCGAHCWIETMNEVRVS